MTSAQPLISGRLRMAVREQLTSWYLGAIDDLFAGEGFQPGHTMVSVSGQRRTRVEEYYATIDWSDPAQVRRYLRLVEMILSRDQSDAEQVVATLRLDGYRLDDRGRIVAASDGLLLDAPLEHLADSEVIEQHLARIFAAIDSDPEGAIGASKELVESLTKLILTSCGQPVPDKATLPQLARSAQKSLGLHPDAVAPDKKGADTIARTLQNLAGVVDGLAELRNLSIAAPSSGCLGVGALRA